MLHLTFPKNWDLSSCFRAGRLSKVRVVQARGAQPTDWSHSDTETLPPLHPDPVRPRHTGGFTETLVVVWVLLHCVCEELLPVPSASLPCSEVTPLPCWVAHWRPHSGGTAQLNSLHHNQAMQLEEQLETPKSLHGFAISTFFYSQSKPKPPNSFWMVPRPATVMHIQ